jgi:probable phosphoglycerate mutase
MSARIRRLVMLRHGQTEFNAGSRMQGQLDSPLTELGLWQAQQLGIRLRNQTFTTLYSSDLPRSARTA